MEHDIPFGNSHRENRPTFLDFPLFLGIFQWDEPTNVFHLPPNRKFRKFWLNGKRPKPLAQSALIYRARYMDLDVVSYLSIKAAGAKAKVYSISSLSSSLSLSEVMSAHFCSVLNFFASSVEINLFQFSPPTVS